MLSHNKKTPLITTLFVSGLCIGGIVNAEQNVVNPANNTGQNTAQAYQFPAANALPQMSTKPQKSNTAKPVNAVAQPPQRMAPPPYSMPRTAPYPRQNRFAPMMPPQQRSPYGANAVRPGYVPMAAPFGPVRAPGYNAGPNGSSPNAANALRPGSMPIQAPFSPGPGRAPGNARPNGSGPYAGGPYGQGPQRPYGQGPQRPYGQGPQGPYGRPNNSGGPFGNNPMDNFGFGPFSNNSNEAPWETWPFGGRDSLWNRREIPFKDQSPTDWFQPGDPKEGMAIMWDDMISSPDELGEMPGGWYVPSVSVPNPVDLEDQLEKASKEVPDLIRIYN